MTVVSRDGPVVVPVWVAAIRGAVHVLRWRTIRVVLRRGTIRVVLRWRTIRVVLRWRTVRVVLRRGAVRVVLLWRTIRIVLRRGTIRVVLRWRTIRILNWRGTIRILNWRGAICVLDRRGTIRILRRLGTVTPGRLRRLPLYRKRHRVANLLTPLRHNTQPQQHDRRPLLRRRLAQGCFSHIHDRIVGQSTDTHPSCRQGTHRVRPVGKQDLHPLRPGFVVDRFGPQNLQAKRLHERTRTNE